MHCISGPPGRQLRRPADLGCLQLHRHHRPFTTSHTRTAVQARIQTAKLQGSNPARMSHSMPACNASSSTLSTPSSTPARVTAESNFAAACTLLGGPDTSSFRGYVGTWTQFDMQPLQDSAASAPSNKTGTAATTTAAAAAPLVPVFVDEPVHFRLFRVNNPDPMTYTQLNLYQGGGGPAASSYKTYLTSDAAPARPDGYGMREWQHDSSGALWNPDGASWRSTPTVAEKTLLGLAVADCGLALINGALPSSFDPQHTPASWWMECIFKQPGSHARRWGMLHRYGSGKLANTKSMNEDLTQMTTEELHSKFIDPKDIKWQERRQGPLGDLDALLATQQKQQQQQSQAHTPKPCLSPQGTATTFTFDEQHQVMMQTGPCSWSSQHVQAMNAAAAAAVDPEVQQQQQVVMQLELPDWGYSMLPADVTLLTKAAETSKASAGTSTGVSGAQADHSAATIVFELGTVLSSGSIARWLLHYSATGGRLLQKAVYELYPAA